MKIALDMALSTKENFTVKYIDGSIYYINGKGDYIHGDMLIVRSKADLEPRMILNIDLIIQIEMLTRNGMIPFDFKGEMK